MLNSFGFAECKQGKGVFVPLALCRMQVRERGGVSFSFRTTLQACERSERACGVCVCVWSHYGRTKWGRNACACVGKRFTVERSEGVKRVGWRGGALPVHYCFLWSGCASYVISSFLGLFITAIFCYYIIFFYMQVLVYMYIVLCLVCIFFIVLLFVLGIYNEIASACFVYPFVFALYILICVIICLGYW